MKFNPEISYFKRAHEYRSAHDLKKADYFQDVAQPYSLKYFLPGHVFTFEYFNGVDEDEVIPLSEYFRPKDKKKAVQKAGLFEPSYIVDKPYYDMRPIGIALNNLGADNQTEYILNLKCMPVALRLKVLELLYSAVVPNILRNGVVQYGEDAGDLIPFSRRINNRKYTQPFLGFKFNQLVSILGQSLYYWVDVYDKNRIRHVKLIDFDSVDRLADNGYKNDPYVRINGATLADVQFAYYTRFDHSED